MERHLKKLKYLILSTVAIPSLTLAAPLFPSGGPSTTANDIVDFIKKLQAIVIGIAGIVAITMFIYGGFLMITSSGNEERLKKAKSTLTAAIIGVIIFSCAYLIVFLYVKLLGGNIQ